MSDNYKEIFSKIDECEFKKLKNDYEQVNLNEEYDSHKKYLNIKVNNLTEELGKIIINENVSDIKIKLLSKLKLLMTELKILDCQFLADQINEVFIQKNNTNIEQYIKLEECYSEVNKLSFIELNKKISLENWKKYPLYIDLYENLLYESYLLEFNLILPPIFCILNDYSDINIIRGLNCMKLIFINKNLTELKTNNYILVIYESLSKLISHKNDEIIKLNFDNLSLLLDLLKDPKELWSEYDDLFKHILNLLYLETKINRKLIYLNFLNVMILNYNFECVKFKKHLNKVLLDNIDLCCMNQNVDFSLKLLEAILNFYKYSWCVIDLKSEKLILVNLLKLLYVFRNNMCIVNDINKILLVLYKCNNDIKATLDSVLISIDSNMLPIFLK